MRPLLDGRTLVCRGLTRLLADPPGVFFPQTPADLLRTPRVRRGSKNPRWIRCRSATSTRRSGGLFGLKKTEKVRQSTKRVRISSPRTFFDFGGLFWWTGVHFRCGFLVRSIYSLLKKSAQKVHFKNLQVDLWRTPPMWTQLRQCSTLG